MANKKIWIVVAIIVVIIMMQTGKKEASGISSDNDITTIIDSRDKTLSQGFNCIGPIVPATTTTNTCLGICVPGLSANGFVYDFDQFNTCSDAYVSAGKCIADCLYGGLPEYLCSDSDGGQRGDVLGSVTNAEGLTILDYCQDSTRLYEFYCESNRIKFAKIDCDCSNGICIGGQCTIPGDTAPACNGIDRTELGNIAQQWMDNPTSQLRTDLGLAAQDWINHGGIA